MANNIFRRFPSDDIDLEPYTEESEIGQSLVPWAVGSVTDEITEDFWEVAGGEQIVSAVGASAGVATASALAAVLWLTAGNSAGSAATSGIAAAVLPTAGSSVGSAAASGLSGTLTASIGASSGSATASAISATIAAVLGSSDGIAVSEAIAAVVLAAVGQSVGTNTANGIGEAIASGLGRKVYRRRRAREIDADSIPLRLDSAEFPFARGLQPTPEQLRLAARAAIPETVSPIPEAVLLPEPSNAVAELATRNRRNRALLIALAEAL